MCCILPSKYAMIGLEKKGTPSTWLSQDASSIGLLTTITNVGGVSEHAHAPLTLRFLANAVAAKSSLQVAVRLISPNQSFSQHLLHHLEAAGSLVPSATLMYRHRLTLTLAWFLHMLEIHASKKNICTYFMVDSSPQGGPILFNTSA